MSRTKIIASLLTKDQEYQTMQGADAERAAARAGFDIEVLYAKNNSRLQVEQLYHFIRAPEQDRPLAIVVQTVVGEGLANVARDAAKGGIGWLLLNRDAPYIDSLRAEYPGLPIGIVTIDQQAIGGIQGRQFRGLLKDGGNILYIQGPADTSAAQQRLQAMQEAVAGAKIEVKVIKGEWTEESGEKSVTSWLRQSSPSDRIDLIAAQNDAMVIGAQRAISARRPEWSKLPFAGCDGLAEGGQRLVNEHKLAATVVLPSTTGPAIDLVAGHQRSGAPLPPRTVLTPRPYPASS
jgi:ABC-type sugar transport system substrate-binding protein